MSVKNVCRILRAVRRTDGRLFDENLPCAEGFKLTHLAVYKDVSCGERVIPVFNNDRFTLTPIDLDAQGVAFITKERLGAPLDTKLIGLYDLPSYQKQISLIVEV